VAGTNFDTTRLRLGDLIAAGGGLLLIISLFLNWYKVSAEGALIDISVSASGWDALGFIDILLFLIGAAAIALAVMRAMGMAARIPAPTGLVLLVLGALATLLVVFRILVIPDGGVDGVDVGRSFGIFVALIAALATLVGGWLTWNDEGRPTSASAGAGSPGGGAVGPGQGGGYGAPPSGAPVGSSAAPPASAPAAAAGPPAGAAATGADAPPPGGKADWYPDPRGQKRLRYYDGTSWTDHVAD
jgi:hypothetical protein